MANQTKINVNTLHLIPAAAVWQSPKIIAALSRASSNLFLMAIFLFGGLFVASQTTFFNGKLRSMMDDYDLCISKFKALKPDYTSREEQFAIRECYAAAKVRSLSANKR